MRKNITLSAEDALIQRAREQAMQEKTTLNALFRAWLERYVRQGQAGSTYRELMHRLGHASPGRTFSRDEMNER